MHQVVICIEFISHFKFTKGISNTTCYIIHNKFFNSTQLKISIGIQNSCQRAYLHCKCETVTILVFSRGSVPAVLQLSIQLLVVGPINLVVEVHISDVMGPSTRSSNDKQSTAGTDPGLKTRIVTVSHLQCMLRKAQVYNF